jgi:aspartyl-tRNA synthetase
VDIEVSFMNQGEVMALVEKMMTETVEKMGYKIKEKPFPSISYAKAIEQHRADKFDLRTDKEREGSVLAYAWVSDFPLFDQTDDGKWTFSHNPFSQPKEKFVEELLAGKNIENILSSQYDLICNGFEVGGGSIRSHKPEILRAMYEVMGYSDEEIQKSVGHMLEAFAYGTPPHGGIALGIERNIMTLTGEDALREVQAFPMTRGGQTSVMKGPSDLSEEQLNELGLQVRKKEK